jgi:hypothetical protein
MINRSRNLTGSLVLLAGVLVVLPGCTAEKAATLSGKVIYKEKLLQGGMVTVVNEDGKLASGPIESNGTYSIKDVPYGKLRVGVMPVGRGALAQLPPGVKATFPKDHPQAELYTEKGGQSVDIPESLRDPATSGVTVTVDSPEKYFDIHLGEARK